MEGKKEMNGKEKKKRSRRKEERVMKYNRKREVTVAWELQ